MQKFLSRLITILIAGYLFFNFLQFKKANNPHQSQIIDSLTTRKTPKTNPDLPSQNQEKNVLKGNFIEKTITNVFLNILETEEGKKLVQNINPAFKEDAFLSYHNQEIANFPTILKQGIGETASCRDVITFDYTKYNQKKDIIQNLTRLTLPLDDKLETIFKLILAKVKSQEEIENQIYFPITNSFENYNLSIKDIKFNGLKNPKYFLKQLQLVAGTGKKVLCGDKMKLQFTLEKKPNDKESSNYNLAITLGSLDIPREITEALLTQRYGTTFTFAANKELLDSITQKGKLLFDSTSLKKDSFAILTLELLDNLDPLD